LTVNDKTEPIRKFYSFNIEKVRLDNFDDITVRINPDGALTSYVYYSSKPLNATLYPIGDSNEDKEIKKWLLGEFNRLK
jgi:hypothetical protein